MTTAVAVVPASISRFYGPGESCSDSQPGDLVLVRHTGFTAAGIRFFERRSVPKEFAWCNHACIVLDGGPDAHVVQEEAKGATVSYLDELNAVEYAVVNMRMTREQRSAVVAFARWSIGDGYGFLSIPADAVNAMTGAQIGLALGNRMVCSTAASRALERGGYIPARSPYAQAPAHLAQDFGVKRG